MKSPSKSPRAALSRRSFVSRVAAASSVAGLAAIPSRPASATTPVIDPLPPAQQRKAAALRIRLAAAQFEFSQPVAPHPDNGDEIQLPNFIGNYSKGLPHNALGEVDRNAYAALLKAVSRGRPDDFESIPLGAPVGRRRKLVNPQAGLAFDLEGADSHDLAICPAPALGSAEAAGEIVENYWMALARDIAFADYESNALIKLAGTGLSRLPDFRGPKAGAAVSPATIFRLDAPGCLIGPYLSQFLWMTPPFGAAYVQARMRTTAAGVSFLTDYSEWLAAQRGFLPTRTETFDPVRRYLRNGRDLGQWVHIDVLYQAYFHALLVLLAGPSDEPTANGLGAPLNPGNPYLHSRNQEGFGTFDGPHIASLLAEVSTRALKAVWFQKWFVHRRLRPEAFAGRIHNHLRRAAEYPLDWRSLAPSPALTAVHELYGSWLLPMAYPEGSPLHPAYGAGHATVAGACVTILKAWFDETHVIANPVFPTHDARALTPYAGPPLTVGGELNKLASNIAMGRNFAGVHWRSDTAESLKLGEVVAISVLRDQRVTYNEAFRGFTFTRFDGSRITV
jgi:hypothetical protein